MPLAKNILSVLYFTPGMDILFPFGVQGVLDDDFLLPLELSNCIDNKDKKVL